MRLSLLTLFTFLSTLFFAQTNGKGIVIIKDKKIDELIQNKSNAKKISTTGYRVQIYFSTNKNELNDVRLKFIKSHPRIETYITYDAPNYLLRVGDFSEKNDAEKLSAHQQSMIKAQHALLVVDYNKVKAMKDKVPA